jgi:hypothetical protein
MEVIGDYHRHGYAHVRELVPQEVARAFMTSLKADIGDARIPLSNATQHDAVLRRAAFEIYGYHYKPMSLFLWGLTPIVSQIVGRDLLPTYDYFRVYREGDVCLVHADRPSCEHSVSLTLDYSDGEIWDLQIASQRSATSVPIEDDFGATPYSSVAMNVGDAVVYQGVHHAHGRIRPNPNAWSAHLFLHFVDRHGPFADHAFDNQVSLDPVNFSFS